MPERKAGRPIAVAEQVQYLDPRTLKPIKLTRGAVLHEDLAGFARQRRAMGLRGPNLIRRRPQDYPGKSFRIGQYAKHDPDTLYKDKTLASDADMIGEALALDVLNIYPDPTEKTFDKAQYPWQKRYYERMLRQRSDILVPVLSGRELGDALKDPRGRTAIVRSLEGIYGWEGNPHELIDNLWKDGIRSLMPVHNDNSNLASGHPSERKGTDEGLTPLGKDLVRYGLERGMIMDLSHASSKTAWDIIDIYDDIFIDNPNIPPPIISHTGSRTLVNDTRNTDDEIAIAVAQRGGIIGVMPAKWIVENEDNLQNASAKSVVRLIDHYLQIFSDAGILFPDEALAIGTDFGGMGTESVIDGIDTLQTLGPGLYHAMLLKGLPDRIIGNILGKNAIDYYSRWLPIE